MFNAIACIYDRVTGWLAVMQHDGYLADLKLGPPLIRGESVMLRVGPKGSKLRWAVHVLFEGRQGMLFARRHW